ncbi:MAG TPA: alpha/beta fold hydrolase [Micromonosporaceae bacterium]
MIKILSATWRPAVAVLLGLVIVVTLLWLVQRRLIYVPDDRRVPPAADAVPGGRDVTLETSDGLRLGAWLVPAGRPDRGMTVLVAHGNAGNRADRATLAVALSRAGFAVLLFDYRGYAGNGGRPSEEGLARDARAAYRYLVENAGVPPDRLIYFGESLGAGVVAELATSHPPAALVLRSPFVDLAAAGAAHYPYLPVRALLRDRYPVAEHLAHVRVPTCVVYGTADTVVPADQSRAVASRAAGPVSVLAIDGADHNDDALVDGPEVVAAVVAVAERVNRSA